MEEHDGSEGLGKSLRLGSVYSHVIVPRLAAAQRAFVGMTS